MTQLSRRAFTAAALGGLASAALLPGRAAQAATSRLALQAIWVNDPEFNGYYIAMEDGYYAAEGLEIDYIPGGPDVIPQAALLTGKADVALTSPPETAEAIFGKGAPFKVIGAQFQKSPDAVIFLEDSGIRTLKDLEGRTVACPPLNTELFRILLKHDKIDADKIKIVPYTFDPTPLVLGEVDAIVDFMTSMPYVIGQAAHKKADYILFSDAGLVYGQNLVCVTEETLAKRRADLVGFLRASRKGWETEFQAPGQAALHWQDSWFKGNGYTPDMTAFHSKIQVDLIKAKGGVFSMSDSWIAKTLETLNAVGIPATPEMFDTSLLRDL
ncbi:ABC transporter substrate-binding protein [Pseudooceanicola sp. CBS1P-1]|uniref:Myristoyl transferase n=1 Tax=Pseudooceanicola albus TaxID=2692189 RepID=A0A6L7G5H0_9RHOB|nr:MULTISPECIES: ABC transporter substrate-binding protein [Pseudooceanicola]MBT9385975.1 ABC transporter substrate-binding protein [Pseudooceanicola endophyticus]MXN19604.1 myristoyl transferase [Pseudooceanicola albus]